MAEQEPLLASEQSHNPQSSSSLSSRVRSGLAQPGKLNGLEKLLALVCVILLLTTATFAGLFAGEAVQLNKYKHRHDRDGGHRDHDGRGGGGGTTIVTSTLTATATATQSSVILPPGPTSTGTPSKNDGTCLTADCVLVAADVIAGLDTSVDPCEDMYQFANGGWLKSHPIPDGQGIFGAAQDIGQRNKRIILDVLQPSTDTSLAEVESSDKDNEASRADKRNLDYLRAFWNSCTDEKSIDAYGAQPIYDAVEHITELWRGKGVRPEDDSDDQNEGEDDVDDVDAIDDDLVMIVDDAGQMAWSSKSKKHHHRRQKKHHDKKSKHDRYDPRTKKERLTNTLMWMHARDLPALFEIYPGGNVGEDPTDLVAWLQQSGLSFPAKDYYKDDKMVTLLKDVIATVLEEIGKSRDEQAPGKDWKQVAAEVVKFERHLAEYGLDVADLEDPKVTYNPVKSNALAKLFPSISFPNYFASFTPRPYYPDPVIVSSPSYLANLTGLLDSTDPTTLEAYFVIRAAQELSPVIGGKQPVHRAFRHLENALTGVSDDGPAAPRSDTCLAALDESWGFLVGRYYVERAFTGGAKSYAEDIIQATIQAFKDRLPELDWLDDQTRKRAEEKASAITRKIGYPAVPDTMDPLSLERYYALNLPVNKTDYAGNVMRARNADKRRAWVKIGRKANKGEWEMRPDEVNAYYSPEANEIVFPAGILQSPYFSKDWPEYLAFGSFGCVAGHELSHAFDQAGRLYNKDGKLEDWWTNKTTARFEHLQQCILDQYSHYAIKDDSGEKHFIRSHLTNGEDMADAGGIEQAFRAWQDRFHSDHEGKTFANYLLPGIEYTREQLFFIAYAQGWRRNIKPAEAVKRIRTDPHSPTNFRVIGPLSNNVAFSKAFGCKVGQPMSNEKKCHVW